MSNESISLVASFTLAEWAIIFILFLVSVTLWLRVYSLSNEYLHLKKNDMQGGFFKKGSNELKSLRTTIVIEGILAAAFSAASFIMIFDPCL